MYEKGDNFKALAEFARIWFNDNNVQIPKGAAAWQKCSVRRGEIPPGTTTGSLRKLGINVTEFISEITGIHKEKYNRSPLTKDILHNKCGLTILSERVYNGHKYITTECHKCNRVEETTYGKMQEFRLKGQKYCRYCRGVGGKEKTLDTYDTYKGFSIVSKHRGRLRYKCLTCFSIVERTMSHFSSSEYIVCEVCHPRDNFGARHATELGYFDSKIEYEAYLVLLKYFPKEDIIRQKKYDELFLTKTKHTADFYIPKLQLVLEVTSKYNKIGEKYKEIAKWKKSLSKNVVFAYSLKEVEDIVRSAMKVAELTVANW